MERSTIGSLLRTTQALCGQLCEKKTLERGIAYFSPRFANLPEANQFREVVAAELEEVTAALTQAEEWFHGLGLTCRRLAPAAGPYPSAMEDFLAARGFRRRRLNAMRLASWADIELADDVRIVPARAMRSAYRSSVADTGASAPDAVRRALTDAYDERLDDPQYDAFVAVVDDRPVGRCTLFQVGDIARVMDFNVSASMTDGRVDLALMAHVLALAKRLAMRTIITQIEEDDPRGAEWFEQVGFLHDGAFIEFERPDL